MELRRSPVLPSRRPCDGLQVRWVLEDHRFMALSGRPFPIPCPIPHDLRGIHLRENRGRAILRSILRGRQCDREAAAALRVVARIAAVPARDLSHESEAEAGVPWAAASGNAVERRKQTLARVRRNHRSAIGHAQRDLTAASLDRDLYVRLAMALRA